MTATEKLAAYHRANGYAQGYAAGVAAAAQTRGGLSAWNATADTRRALLARSCAAFKAALDSVAPDPTEARLLAERTA